MVEIEVEEKCRWVGEVGDAGEVCDAGAAEGVTEGEEPVALTIGTPPMVGVVGVAGVEERGWWANTDVRAMLLPLSSAKVVRPSPEKREDDDDDDEEYRGLPPPPVEEEEEEEEGKGSSGCSCWCWCC